MPDLPSNATRGSASIAPSYEILVGLITFASGCAAIFLTRIPGGIALFWPASAIAAAILIRAPRVRWGRAAIYLMVAILLANVVVAHRPWYAAALFAGVNLAEIAAMVAVFRFLWPFPYPDITIGQGTAMTLVFGVAIPGVAAMLGGMVLNGQYATPYWPGMLQWWSSHTIGACLLGPPIILFSIKGIRQLSRAKFLFENALILLGVFAACYVAIRYVRFPFVVIGIALLTMAFRVGGLGASILSLCAGLIITNLWAFGFRPLGLDPRGAAAGSLIGIPVLALLCTVMPSIAVGLGSDARRASARALRVSERRFRESMEHSPIGMLIADLNGIWSYTNLALQGMLGYTAAEFRNLPPGGPSKHEDWKGSESRWGQLLAGKIESYDVLRSFQHKDGHWIWAHVAVSALRDVEGKPINLIAQIESLEARQLAEEKIADERERLKITLESISDAVITTDSSTRITYINPAAEAMLGLGLNSVATRRVDEVIHLMDALSAKSAENLISQCTLHQKVYRREQACLLHRTDGAILYVTDVVSPVLDTNGLLSGMVIVLHDATLDMDRALDLQRRATRDPLTGLSNRADFERQLHGVFGRFKKLDRPAAILAIDLDRFKAVNDSAGHAAGDAMLRKVAEACRIAVRSSDIVARLGGDEFAIILDNCPRDRAIRLSQKLLRALNPMEIEWAGARYAIGASMGMVMSATDMPDENTWLNTADQACYKAKRSGRGQLHVVTQEQADSAQG
jgi:diguanylate cyclase